jgi:arylsulfatase A-like enzyme
MAPLIAKLTREKLCDETLVIITADHGEEVFEHGVASHQQPNEETSRVPLILIGPGVPVGLRVEKPVGLVDLMPTVLSLLDLPIPAGVQGQDLKPLVAGRDDRQGHCFRRWTVGRSAHDAGSLPQQCDR